jgi:hypothetical protein
VIGLKDDRRIRLITTGRDAVAAPAAGETELFESSDGSDCYDRFWHKAAVHAQQHLVVDKHELEMQAIRIIRVELLCRVRTELDGFGGLERNSASFRSCS